MNAVSKPEQAGEIWNRSELSLLHRPLVVLNEHIQCLRRIDESVDMYTSRMNGNASTITSEARGLQAQLESLRYLFRNRTLKRKNILIFNWSNGPPSLQNDA